MKKIFKINIFFYIFAIILIFSGYINYFLIFLFIMFIHELGHIIAIKILGYKIEKIDIYPCGGVISTNILINIPSIHMFIISISGVLAQFLLFILIPNNYSYNYEIFVLLNKSLITFNLLPIFPLDGFKIYLAIYENLMPYRLAVILSDIISFIALFIMFIYTKSI